MVTVSKTALKHAQPKNKHLRILLLAVYVSTTLVTFWYYFGAPAPERWRFIWQYFGNWWLLLKG